MASVPVASAAAALSLLPPVSREKGAPAAPTDARPGAPDGGHPGRPGHPAQELPPVQPLAAPALGRAALGVSLVLGAPVASRVGALALPSRAGGGIRGVGHGRGASTSG